MGAETNSKCFRLTLSYPANAEMRRITTTPSSCIKGIKNEFWLEEGRRKKLDFFFPSQSLAIRFSTEVAGLGDGQGVPTALLQRPGVFFRSLGPISQLWSQTSPFKSASQGSLKRSSQ